MTRPSAIPEAVYRNVPYGDPRSLVGETLTNLSNQASLRSFSDEPVSKIVQCGEPNHFNNLAEARTFASSRLCPILCPP